MDIKEKVLHVMQARAALEEKTLGARYPFRMATWNLRLAMEKAYPDDVWTSDELRKVLIDMVRDGDVTKDIHYSRIGQAVWKLEKRDA